MRWWAARGLEAVCLVLVLFVLAPVAVAALTFFATISLAILVASDWRALAVVAALVVLLVTT